MKKSSHKLLFAAVIVFLAGVIAAFPCLKEQWYIHELRGGSSTVRCHASWQLATMKSHRAVPALIELLRVPGHSRARVNCCAVSALGTIGDRRAVAPIIAILESPQDGATNSVRFRSAAAMALGKIRDVKAVECLEGMLADTGYAVGESAMEALLQLGQDEGTVHSKRVRLLIDILSQSADSDQRKGAAQILGEMGAKEAVPSLYQAITNPVEAVRAEAYRSLRRLGEPEHDLLRLRHDYTLACLTNASPNVRREAAKGIMQVAAAADVDALEKSLEDSDYYVRWCAAESLGRIGDPRVIPALQAAKSDKNWHVQYAAVWSLANLGDKSVIPELKDLYREYPTVNSEITDRLKRLGVTDEEIAQAKAVAHAR